MTEEEEEEEEEGQMPETDTLHEEVRGAAFCAVVMNVSIYQVTLPQNP